MADTGAEMDAGSSSDVQPSPRSQVRAYMFGHSLVDWAMPNTQVGTAMCSIAQQAGDTCCANGTYVEFVPTALGAYPWPPPDRHIHRPSCWNESFADSGFDTITMTETNFYWNTREPSDGFPEAGARLVRQVRGVYPDIPVYLYEHWPPFEEFRMSAWIDTHHVTYHQWFARVQDLINQQSPGADVRLIPVGWIFARLLAPGRPLAGMTNDDLFVDVDPHGTGTTYYISGLIHYMALFQKRPPANMTVPSYVHPTVRNNIAAVVDFAWNELLDMVDESGNSRVFGP